MKTLRNTRAVHKRKRASSGRKGPWRKSIGHTANPFARGTRSGTGLDHCEIPCGGAGGDRTRDLLNAIQALSQLSYGPTERGSYRGARSLSKLHVAWRRTPRVGDGGPILQRRGMLPPIAGVVELVYAGDSKSPGRKALRVQIPPPAPHRPQASDFASVQGIPWVGRNGGVGTARRNPGSEV